MRARRRGVDMKIEPKRKRGGFLSALGFFTFFFLLLIAIAIAVAYTNRDRLILEYLRQEGPRALGVEVLAVDSLVTRPVGQVSVELRNLVFQSSKSAPLIRAEKVLLSTPRNLLSLYQLYFTHDVLNLKAQLIGVQVRATSETGAKGTTAATPAPPQELKLRGLPFPIELETEIRSSSIEAGPPEKPILLRHMTGIIRTEISNRMPSNSIGVKSTGQIALGIALGEHSELPIRTDWAFTIDPVANDPKNVAVNITSLTISSLGMSLKSNAKIKWPEQTFTLEAAGQTSDLGVLPVEKAESDALGLTGRLKGSAEVSLKMSGSLTNVITAEGSVRLKDGRFPFDIAREKPKPFTFKGPAEVDLETPFRFAYHVPSGKFKSIDLQLATFKVDLTAAELKVAGLLRKPAQVMMAVRGQMTAQGETIDVSQLEVRLANLFSSIKGQVSIDPKRHSKLDIQMTLPSLKGWPSLLPVLGQIDAGPISNGTDLNQAQGSFALKAQAELPLGAPETIMTDSRVDVEVFDANGVEFPISIKEDKRTIEGMLHATLSAGGSIAMSQKNPMAWSLKRAQGSVDLRKLNIQWDDFLRKPAGQDLSLNFNASAPAGLKPNEVRVRLDRFDIHATDSSASVAGVITREDSGDIVLDAKLQSHVVLSRLYDLAPVFRSVQSKVRSGTVVAGLQAIGTYRIKEGPAGSPIALKGRIALKSPRAVLLDVGTSADPTSDANADVPETAASKAAADKDAAEKEAMLHWPLVSKANLVFDAQFESIAVKTSDLKNVAVLANLQNGDLRGSVSSENAFGGPLKITSFAVPDLPRKPYRELKASAAGNFQGLNLGKFAEFLSPIWKTYVGGIASGNFILSALPFHRTSLAENANVSGALTVKQGLLSTVSFDRLVNQKLTENPEIAKLLRLTPKVATGGAYFDVITSYAYAKNRAALKGLHMVTPEKNELALDGWLQKDLEVDLKGFAYLAETPIGGAIRQANSDKLGRLIVPIKITGSLKAPSLDIAQEAIQQMTKKAVANEVGKLKEIVKKEAAKVIEQKKQEATKSAVDAVKEELKKRGLGF